MAQRDLMELSIEDAARVKFLKGQAEHGVEFKIDVLIEMHDEWLDIINYCDVAVDQQGYDRERLGKIRSFAVDMCKLTREIYAEKHQ